MASIDGSDQEADPSYQNSFASLDAAAAILDILYRTDPLSEGNQGAGRDDASEEGELAPGELAPQGPPESPTRTQI